MDNELQMMDLPLWNDPESNKIFLEMCKEENINPRTIRELVALVKINQGKLRARGINDDIEICLRDGD